MRFLLFVIGICCSVAGRGQLVFETESIDLGDLGPNSQRYTDIEVKNTGKKKEYFLSFRKPPELVSLSKGESVLPDSSSFIRVQVNPKKKGKFEYELSVFTSDKPEATIIKVKGNFTGLPDDLTAQYQNCPDFSTRPVNQRPTNTVVFKTIDAQFKSPVDAEIFLVQNGTDVNKIKTKAGSGEEEMPIGHIYVFVRADNYKSLDTVAFVNPKNKELVLELEKNPSFLPAAADKKDTISTMHSVSQPEKEEEQNVSPDMRLDLRQELAHAPVTQTDSIPNIALDSIPLENFDPQYFRPVNVVFVLDVSSSMGSNEKFDLLKFSLVQLLDILRPEDKIALVSYATSAKVLVPSTSGGQKDQILPEIKKLRASGQTAGMEGIKAGFEEAERALIADGTNLVVVITDGAFNKNNGNYLKVIEKYREKNIFFSVVGVKNLPVDEENMREAARKGNGAYVPVFRLADAQQNVIREIKRVAFKGI